MMPTKRLPATTCQAAQQPQRLQHQTAAATRERERETDRPELQRQSPTLLLAPSEQFSADGLQTRSSSAENLRVSPDVKATSRTLNQDSGAAFVSNQAYSRLQGSRQQQQQRQQTFSFLCRRRAVTPTGPAEELVLNGVCDMDCCISC